MSQAHDQNKTNFLYKNDSSRLKQTTDSADLINWGRMFQSLEKGQLCIKNGNRKPIKGY